MKQYLLILIAILQLGCDKLFIEDTPENTHVNNFELLWSTVNDKYCFFEYKNIDWNKIHDKYQPLIDNSSTDELLFQHLSDMVNELKDGHVYITSSFNTSRYWKWFTDHDLNFYPSLLEKYYLKTNFSKSSGLVYREIRDVGYIRYESFLDKIDLSALEYIIDKFRNTKGIIIDVRDNGGGSIANVARLISPFITEKTTLGFIKYKQGSEHNNFSKAFEQTATPLKNKYSGKVVVLTNRKVYSAANYFVSAIKDLPNITIIGDSTGGGGGIPLSNELYNGWQIALSTNIIYDKNMNHIEFGIAPNIKVNISEIDRNRDFDTILEFAIDKLQ